jgi:hypothetical protein
MTKKKIFQIYYLLVSEGTTEYNLFAYLTRNRFRELFYNSNIKFSDKVEIAEVGISKGKLNGASDISSFESKYKFIKKRYKGQKRFFILDKDLDDSLKIADAIKKGKDIVQFIEYNSEYLLLNFADKNPKKPSHFVNLEKFRSYCKAEFQKQFGKKASQFQDPDFEKVLKNISDEEVKEVFSVLFSTL